MFVFFLVYKTEYHIRLCYIFEHTDTIKTLNSHFISCFIILEEIAELH